MDRDFKMIKFKYTESFNEPKTPARVLKNIKPMGRSLPSTNQVIINYLD